MEKLHSLAGYPTMAHAITLGIGPSSAAAPSTAGDPRPRTATTLIAGTGSPDIESIGNQKTTWPNSGPDGWEDDGGSVAKVGAARPTFNL
ncbi:MAG: hypothetical protein U5S82_02950 [Gammaproteobacteria bacterium]|nr:hypothetical protein [Gammaproteobacteria bacterium]